MNREFMPESMNEKWKGKRLVPMNMGAIGGHGQIYVQWMVIALYLIFLFGRGVNDEGYGFFCLPSLYLPLAPEVVFLYTVRMSGKSHIYILIRPLTTS